LIDSKITPAGDFAIESATGDLALTGYSKPVSNRDEGACLAQLARIALSTEKGDFLLYAALGSELKSIVGLPNSAGTAAKGVILIKNALASYGIRNKVYVDAWPEDHNTLAFEVRISLGASDKELSFIVRQALNEVE
jgi:hypothetical protein